MQAWLHKHKQIYRGVPGNVNIRRLTVFTLLTALTSGAASAGNFDTRIPMRIGHAATFYVDGHIANVAHTEFMVDTGSSVTTINQLTLDQLIAKGLARYDRELSGTLADGSQLTVPVYRVASLHIGGCVLKDVETAVFDTRRQILGLSALNRAAPFIFSVDPPELVLSNCVSQELPEPR